MTPVVFSRLAVDDLTEIAAYISERNPSRAHSFAEELVAACRDRGLFPDSGRRRRDVAENLYTFPYGRYLIIYSVEDERVLIRRVVHGARNLEAPLRDL